MNSLRFNFYRVRLIWLFIGVLLISSSVTASRVANAQATKPIPTPSLLTRKVHLSTDTNTLAEVTKAVSDQTGLKVEAASYLRQRKIIMQVDNLSVSDLLDTLAELNDWKWREIQSSVILIERRKKALPQQIIDVPLALQADMPADVRLWIGGANKLRDSMYYEEAGTQVYDARGSFRNGNEVGMRSNTKQWRDKLYELLKPDLKLGIPTTYTRLTSVQQHALLVPTVLKGFSLLNAANSHDILQGILRPYELNVAVAEITCTDSGMFHISFTKHIPPDRIQATGFGIDIGSLIRPLDPKQTPH